VDAFGAPGRPRAELHFGEVFDALLLLHRGLPQQAVQVLHTPPGKLTGWHDSVWRPWYAALWAEAAVMSGQEDAVARVDHVRLTAAENPIATAIVDRTAAWDRRDADRDALTAAAAALEGTGCRYQWARTLVFIGGEQRAHGESVLATMGATPMVWPPG
jgi:hypothetical protein